MLPPLANVDDLAARYAGTLTDPQATRAAILLADASTTIRSYTRQTFAVATTTERIRPIGDRIRLRQSPVTGVGAVAIVNQLQTGNLLTLPMGAWLWDGGQEVWLGPLTPIINLPDELIDLLQYQVPLMSVTYTHGEPLVPDGVIAVACSMVIRAIDLPGPTGISSQTIGNLGYSLGGVAGDGALGLTASEKKLLSQYCRHATTVELR